jgi:MFS transporter, YNFM family, putative membrane transport protein
MLADRWGRKRTIVASAVALAVFSLLAALSPTLEALIVCRFLQGICTPGVFSVTVAYINDEWAGNSLGRAMSAYVSGTVIGGFTSRFIAGVVASEWGWRASFVVLGMLSIVAAVVVWAVLTQERQRPRAGVTLRLLPGAVRAHLRNQRLLAAYAVGFCVLFTQVAIFSYVVFHLAEAPYSLEPAALGSIFFVYVVGAAANPLAGRGIDHWGPRRVLITGIAAGMVGLGLTFVPSLWAVGLGLALTATGVFAAQTSGSMVVGLAASENRSLAIGLYATFYYCGGSLGAILPGYFWDWGGWPYCAASIAVVQLLTVTMALRWWSGGVGPSTSRLVPRP